MFSAALRRLRDPSSPICTSELAGRHTALIEAIHRQAHVENVPPEMIVWSGLNGDASQVPEIVGLAEALRRSYVAEQSLAASGFSLAAPSSGS